MEYSNANLSNEQTCLSCVELPKICIPIYREVIKEMAEVIKVPQMREVFYSLSIGIDVLTVSKKTGVAPRNLAYMYKKASRQVCLKWKPYSAWKQELDRIYIRCRNYAAFLTHYQECTGQNLKNVVIFVKEQDTFGKKYNGFSDCVKHFTYWIPNNLSKTQNENVKTGAKVLGLKRKI